MSLWARYAEGATSDLQMTQDGEKLKGGILGSVGRVVSKVTRPITNVARSAVRNPDQFLDSVAATVMDPKQWVKASMTGGITALNDIQDNYDMMDDLDKAENKALYDEAMALGEEQRLADEQAKTLADQAKKVKEKKDAEDKISADRAQRLASGRKGLLFGSETGVKDKNLSSKPSNKIGG